MARTTRSKKTQAAPEVNVGKEIFESLRELEKLKGIPVEYMIDRLKQALTNAYRKDREDHRDIPAENVVVGISEEGLSMHQIKTVVEELTDIALEIHIDTARRYNPNIQLGDSVAIPVDIAKFGRIAAQTAKQVIIQGIREAERGAMYESYSSKAQRHAARCPGRCGRSNRRWGPDAGRCRSAAPEPWRNSSHTWHRALPRGCPG